MIAVNMILKGSKIYYLELPNLNNSVKNKYENYFKIGVSRFWRRVGKDGMT